MRDMRYTPSEIEDRMAIQDVITRYAHAIDARDYDRLDDVFTPGCTFDLSDAGGAAAVGWSELKPWYADNLAKFEHYLHALTNLLVDFADGRRSATSVCKVINPCGMRTADGEMHHFEVTGHWHDSWARTADGWRIAARRWQAGWIWGDYPFEDALGGGAGT